MTCGIFMLIYEFSFPPKKTNRFILLEIHRTTYRTPPYKYCLPLSTHYIYRCTCIMMQVNGFFFKWVIFYAVSQYHNGTKLYRHNTHSCAKWQIITIRNQNYLYLISLWVIITCAEMEINHPRNRIWYPVQTAVIGESCKETEICHKSH